MKMFSVLAAGLPIMCLLTPFAAIAQTYTATVLYPLTTPNGFQATEVSNAGAESIASQTVGAGELSTVSNFDEYQALLWTSAGAVNLNPLGMPGAAYSEAYATSGSQQVGVGWSSGASPETGEALLWNGTAASAVNLNPAGYDQSAANFTNGSQQVGYATLDASNLTHAMLWNGSAASFVDLNPSGYYASAAFGTDGTRQVGTASYLPFGYSDAILWTGTASSAVVLTATNMGTVTSASALGIGGSQEVGYFETTSNSDSNAVLWTGSAASVIDLNSRSFGIQFSEALATNGSQQVGWGTGIETRDDDALLWSGSAASTVDLAKFLPTTTTWLGSEALSIDSSGDVFGIAYTFGAGSNGQTAFFDYAVEWSPVPEPATGALLITMSAAALFRRKRSPRPKS